MSVTSAKSDYEIARAKVVTTVKDEIKASLAEAFSDPTVESIVFGVCTAPYNDENPGQGVFGPLVNTVEKHEDGEFADAFENYDASYELFYNHHGVTRGDNRVTRLANVLSDADWDFVGEALGVAYYPEEGHGRQSAFVATRNNPEGAYYFYEHEIDY